MSLEITEEEVAIDSFPADKNVRVKITGLALCKFTAASSTVRFLRHVKHHELLMKITQMKTDMTDKKTFTVKIGPEQNVEITGSNMTHVASHIYSPTLPELSFDNIVKMQAPYLHNRRTLEDKPHNSRVSRPTTLTLHHCAFYTDKLTNKEYVFENIDGDLTDQPRKYCEILGGYLAYQGSLTISILSDGLPLNFPLTDYLYEIEFSNACDTSPGCREEEDFRFMYDIVREQGNHGRVFKLIESGAKSINTGACLPVCEDC